MLRNAGVEVVTGVCGEQSRDINKRFFTFNELKRPYVILKWAMSADGFIDVIRPAGAPVKPYWITGMTERILVHKWRSEEQAILAGGGTIRSDNPQLNVRYWHGNDPLKVIISRSSKLDPEAAVFSDQGKTILFTAREGASFRGTVNECLDCREEEVAGKVLDHLYSLGIQSVFIEGGRKVHEMFIVAGLWDEARVFKGKVSWGTGVPSPVLNGKNAIRNTFADSVLEISKLN
jgi:diaminohydroxyphosphoribosylaminopyrimidine deaminase/5-amino-6-(5-phosphoribosylamino)uracil reductase